MRLIIVSGRSGSGKSTALDVLEDNGFYCIDNLPAGLLPDLAERFLPHSDMLLPQVAVSIDARNLLSQLKRFPELLEEVRKRNIRCDVLYLDAEDETLLKRFSETRRRHPLTNDKRSLAEAIAYESLLLAPITDRADLKIDTTRLNLYQLRDTLKLRLLGNTILQEAGEDITVDQWGILNLLWEADGQTPVELARRADKDKPNVTRLLKILEDKALVVRKPDPKDRRSHRIHLTEAGNALKDKLLDLGILCLEQACLGLSSQEVATLKSLLNRVYANVS